MSNKCDKIKDQIADLVTGVLSESQAHTLRQHLSECPECKDYAEALQKQDQWLTGLFARFDTDMTGKMANAVNYFSTSKQIGIISLSRVLLESSMAKSTAAAVVIFFIAMYFIITLTWISQIKECII